MRRVARGVGWAAVVLAVAGGGRGLMALSAPGPTDAAWDARTVASLRWLADGLGGKADRMQALFPEGRVFTLALTGLAWAELGRRDSRLAGEALREAHRALALATDSTSRATFGPAGGLPHGMFYEAWTARLGIGVARLERGAGVAPDTTALAASCRRLARVFADGPVFPDSYPGAAWPADAVVGAAALAGCGDVLGGSFRPSAQAWLGRAQHHADSETGLLPHDARSPHPRGSSSALMIPFLAEIDPSLARGQYRAFVDAFGVRALGVLPAIREYPRGVEGTGDIDSGPVVLGVSAPASVVGIAAARATGDAEAARALRASTEAAGIPLAWGGKLRYAFGRLPVGDAFLAWASAVPMGTGPPGALMSRWRGRWALASGLLVGLGVLGGLGLWRSRGLRSR